MQAACVVSLTHNVLQLQKCTEERLGQIEGLAHDLKATQKEVGRLRPLEQRVRDLLGDIKQQQSDKDR